MKIKIAIYNNGSIKSIYADEETNEFTIGDVDIKKGVSLFVRNAITLVKTWPEKLVDESGMMLDIGYKIAYDDGNISNRIEANGKFPDDFYKLSKLIYSFEDPLLYTEQLRKSFLDNK